MDDEYLAVGDEYDDDDVSGVAIGEDEIIGEVADIIGADPEDVDEALAELISGVDDDDDDDDMIGDDDDDDLIGALADEIGRRRRRPKGRRIVRRRRRPRKPSIAARMRRARAIDPNAVYVARRNPNNRRRLMMGIPRVSVPLGGSLEIEIKPQRKIRVERVSVPSSNAEFFQFLDIKVGQNSQFAAAGAVPCECFTEVARDAYVHFDTANPGYIMTFLVENLDTVNPHTFSATLFGTALV